MKFFSTLAVILALSLGFASADADAARRLGSGKNTGMQRESMPSKPANANPTQNQASQQPAAAPNQAQPGRRSWMGPLAGLAAGLGLAALASHFGFGEELANFMMMALIGVAIMIAIGFFMRKRAAAANPALAGAGAGAQANPFSMQRTAFEAPASSGVQSSPLTNPMADSAPVANIPADFDVAGFVRSAKVHYIRLQAANDAGNLDDLREFTTPEMFAEIRLTINERGNVAQTTDVLHIDAELIEVVQEPTREIASVRFTGQIREDNGPAETIHEIWHMTKPRQGSGGWVLAGIQQAN